MMLSGNETINLESLLAGTDYVFVLDSSNLDSGQLNWSWTAQGLNNVDRSAWNGFHVFYDPVTRTITIPPVALSSDHHNLDDNDRSTDSDTESRLAEMRGLLPATSMEFIGVESSLTSSPAEALIAISSMLRFSEDDETSYNVPSDLPTPDFVATPELWFPQRAVSLADAKPVPTPASGNKDRLERSWSFEVAVLPEEPSSETDSSSTRPFPKQSVPAEDAAHKAPKGQTHLQVAGDTEQSLSPTHAAFTEGSTGKAPVEQPNEVPKANQVDLDDAFAGWTGHAEVRRHAVSGAMLALLAASRWRATQAVPPTQNEQRPGGFLPLRRG